MAIRKAGDVWVAVHPDASLFGTQAREQIKRAMAGVSADVPVNADTKGAVTSIEALKTRMAALNDKLASLRITADDKQAEAVIARVQVKMAALARTVASITMGADTTKLDAAIAAEKAKLAAFTQQASQLKMNADNTAAIAKIAALELQAARLDKALKTMKGDLNITAATTKLAAIRAELNVLKDDAQVIKLGADKAALDAAITASEARIADLKNQASDIRLNVNAAGLLAADAQLLALEATAEKLAPALGAGDAALGVFARTITGAGRGWGVLTGQVTLFGGVLNRVLPVIASSVAVWHVAADAVIEFAAVWIPAGLAVAAFAVAASDAAVEIVNRMTAVHTAMDATGQSIPPMTNALENLHKAVQPQVYQLFGDALTIMNSRAGTFALVAKATGTVLDQLGARIVAAVMSSNKLGASTNQLSGFWKTAVIDVSKLGDSIGNVFGIFGNFFKVIPGFATGLLTIGDDFTKVLESASAAAEPVLKWVLLLHGFILYTGLAVSATLAFIGGLANLARQFVTFAASSVLAGIGALKAFGSALVSIGLALAAYVESIVVADGASASFAAALAPLAANPMIWVTAAAIALGALVAWLVTSKTAAENFNAAMQQTITNASLASLQSTLQQAAAATAAKLAGANRDLNQALSQQGPAVTGAATRWSSNYSPAVDRAATSVHQLTAGQQQIASQAALVSGRIGALSKQYGGNTQALGALVAAGITSAQITDKNKDKWAQALIQVNATTQAYKAMGSQAGVLGNDLDVLGRTVTDQYTAIQKLNQAWSAFIGDVTGTQGSFDTVAQGFFTLADHSAKLTFSLGKLKVSYADANVAIDSLTPAGIALNQAFGDQVVNIDKLFASWRTAGLSNNLFTQGVKDAIAPMVKYANGSQEATAQLVALAQEAGYQGPISMAALTKWLGNTHGATQNLKNITNQATTQEALLTGAMQNQGAFIANTLIGDINSAILAYNGVGKAAAAYGTAIAQFGKDSAPAIAAQKTLADAIVKSGVAAGDGAKTIEATLAKVLGISVPQAVAVFNAAMVSTGLAAAAASAQAKTAFATASASIIGDFSKQQAAAKQAGAGVNVYTDAIRANGVASGEAKAARQQLITDMTGAGVKAVTAKADVAAYTTAIQQNGIDSAQAAGARAKLISDILAASNNAKQGKTDLANYSASVRQNGTDSSATAGARAKLIADLVASGVSARTATGLVDGLGTSIGKLHGATAQVIVNAAGTGQITITGTGWALGQGGIRFHAAQGGLVRMGTGPAADDVPAMLSKGELVVPAKMVRAGAVDNLRGMLPGFAAGGFVGVESLLGTAPPDSRTIAGNLAGKATSAAITQAMAAIKKQVMAKAAAAAAAAGGGGYAGPGSGNYTADIQAVLKKFGLPLTLTANWLRQIQTESGGSLTAVNRTDINAQEGHPSVGLLQIIPGTFAAYSGPYRNTPPLVNEGGGTVSENAMAQIYTAIHYADVVYHGAAMDQIIGHGHGYAAGGLVGYADGGPVPGYAAGGTVASLRSALAKEQTGEKAKYFGLGHSFAIGPAKYRTKTVTGELATLANRQSLELAAYSAIAGAGLTNTSLHHLGATARAVSTVAADQGLSKMPGGHPAFASDLRKFLGQISSTASGSVPAGATGGIPPVPPPPKAGGGGTGPPTIAGSTASLTALRKQLDTAQKGEAAKYFGLEHSFAIGPASGRTKTTVSELATLAKRQSAELTAYKALAGKGLTTANLAHFGATARSELSTASDQVLSRAALAGGHPLFAADLRKYLGQISSLSGTKISAIPAPPPPPAGGTGGTTDTTGGGTTDTTGGGTTDTTGGGTTDTTGGGTTGTSGGGTTTPPPAPPPPPKSVCDVLAGLAGIAGWTAPQIAAAIGSGGVPAAAPAAQVAKVIEKHRQRGFLQGSGNIPLIRVPLNRPRAGSIPGWGGLCGGGVVMDSGGWLAPGWNPPMLNNTGQPEHLVPAGSGGDDRIDKLIQLTAAHLALTRQLIQTTAAVPAQTGRHVGGAIHGATATASFRSRYPRGGS